MKVLKFDEESREVRLYKETEELGRICNWIHCDKHCTTCIVNEYVEESEKLFPKGLTFDEVFSFLEEK